MLVRCDCGLLCDVVWFAVLLCFGGVLVCLCVVLLFRKGVCAFACELLGDVVCCLCVRVCV